MNITDFIGTLGYMGLTGAFILCAALIVLCAFLHFRRPQGLENLVIWLAYAQTMLLGLAVLALGALLQMGAYQYQVVFNAVENAMTPLERLGGLWSAQASSLLFFSFLLSAAASLSIHLARGSGAALVKTILLVLQTTLLFFILPDVFFANPFLKSWMLPAGEISYAVFPPESAALLLPKDGQGMNPSLRHIAMLLHPPTLYLGLIGFFIPYAFLLAALVKGGDPAAWLRRLYPVVLVSWVMLTAGMFLGSWWAYTILGWGGYWGWDAVEISGLVPWLLSFGLIHSMRMQLRGHAFQRWTNAFTLAIVILTLFGILVTRSGILESVHAYSSGAMGPVLSVLILLHLCASLFLLAFRRGDFAESAAPKPANREERILKGFNGCLAALVLVSLFGQTLPLTSQLFGGASASFSIADYERWTALPFLLLIVLTALCPLAGLMDSQPQRAWKTIAWLALLAAPVPVFLLLCFPLGLPAAAGFWAAAFFLASWLLNYARECLLPAFTKKSFPLPRLGVNLIHIGLAVLALGILGTETLSGTYEGQLVRGSPIRVNGFAFSAGEFGSSLDASGNVVFEVPVSITHGNTVREVRPAVIHFTKLGTLYARPGLAAGWLQDAQVILEQTPRSAEETYPVRITFYPLINWIWAGGALMILGGLMGFFRRKPR